MFIALKDLFQDKKEIPSRLAEKLRSSGQGLFLRFSDQAAAEYTQRHADDNAEYEQFRRNAFIKRQP